MDVFSFRDELIRDYEKFSRSFTKIKSEDIKKVVDEAYHRGKFWPAPIIQLNPNYVPGGSIEELVEKGLLVKECAKIFRLKSKDDSFGKPLTLHRHQREAIEIAAREESYVLTTGTGSGKSLSYFIPIVDHVLRKKAGGAPVKGISAIVVYPMNALCNSQMDELQRFLEFGYGKGREPVTFGRYTGQERMEEREKLAEAPPDILLTNYVMLELLMTRFNHEDVKIRENARGLNFLVLDELHTYRGRQGADVAMLVRRVRERFNDKLICIGTSATMGSEGGLEERNRIVSEVATCLFGTWVKPENIITETLRPVIGGSIQITKQNLAEAISRGLPDFPSIEELGANPVAAWIERRLGLEMREGRPERINRPKTVNEAAEMLSEESGAGIEESRKYLSELLLKSYASKDEKGRSFFAFRLHQFISGAWSAYATLEPEGQRYITLEGQQFKPGDRSKLLFTLSFCRECGWEYYPVWSEMEGTKAEEPISFAPRDLSDRSNEDESIKFGFLTPDEKGLFDPNDLEKHFPEEWLEYGNGIPALKRNYQKYTPRMVNADGAGKISSEGTPFWFIPGALRFCLKCGVYYDGSKRSDLTKLSGLSSEGRSSATTVLVLSSLRHLLGADLDDRAKKVLGFTDNRQDASLQAGHFNDLIQILLLRGALLAALKKTPGEPVTDSDVTNRVMEALRLDFADYSAAAEAKGPKVTAVQKTFREVLGYRLYADLRRGWRITNPNLEQLQLLQINYDGLEICCGDEEEWNRANSLLGSIPPEKRFEFAHSLLDQMRKNLCIKSIYLDPIYQEQVRNRSFNDLKEPWGFSEFEMPEPSNYMIPRPRPKKQQTKVKTAHISWRSAFARKFKAQSFWGVDNVNYPDRFGEKEYNALIDEVLRILSVYGYVAKDELSDGSMAYRIDAGTIRWRLWEGGDCPDIDKTANPFFRELYENVSDLLLQDENFLHQLEAREHTAQVEGDLREEREERFRRGLSPTSGQGNDLLEKRGLPVLFCSPTMELGVDISTLNTVYMRNVPPTPANYVQRSGRAGRSGQPALVVTYCAAKSPHDQYFFADPPAMVAGVVKAPAIDLANEDLVKSHLHAVWLAETGAKLGSSIRDVLDLENQEELSLEEDIVAQIKSPAVKNRARERVDRILVTLEDFLTPENAAWFAPTWSDHVINGADLRFDEAFRRWRSLYRATVNQMKKANEVLNNAAAGQNERREAKSRYDEAYVQQNLLLESRMTMNSDFYTYRYLASEGFLPGYNFPRLPLMAFIPGRRERAVRDSFLSRPRFLGLSEFGPMSIIYHEGSTYKVRRAILTIREEGAASLSTLPVHTVKICPLCGYCHPDSDSSLCDHCGGENDGGRMITNLYRIEQVSTRLSTRITSDEEERQRQGYDMVTTIRFSTENGRMRRKRILVTAGEEELLELAYGPAATLWRVNLGWKRRKKTSIYGFFIDVNSGEWTKDSQSPSDLDDDDVRAGTTTERITPYVEDIKNILMVTPKETFSESAIVTLQHAIKRGIEQEFQIEEAELAAEPLPDAQKRNSFLFYEAAEGGAGVLTRLCTDSGALSRAAKKALEICHYSSKSGQWSGVDDLVNGDEVCEAGCYKCLLSYYNQTDHEKIDRKNPEALDFLCRLIRSERRDLSDNETIRAASVSSLEKKWLDYLEEKGCALPDKAQRTVRGHMVRPDFEYSGSQALIFIDGPHHRGEKQKILDKNQTEKLESDGYTVIRFGQDLRDWDGVLGSYSWLFMPDGGEGASL